MKKYNYDYVIIGSGLFGSVFAFEAKKRGKRCLVIEKKNHIGGNIYTENIEGINVHKYGAHIFHTSNKFIWKYVNSLIEFNRFSNMPLANYKGELYNLPFNMNTFYQLWGVKTPKEAQLKLEEQRLSYLQIIEPKNLEEQALVLAGKDIYEKLIKGYTEKQWGRPAKELPAFIIRRLPFRFIFDNNYFNDIYQGIPIGGYTKLIEKLLCGIEIRTGINYLENREELDNLAEKIIYTGRIDEFYNYKLGKLEYRSLNFINKFLETSNFQGNAVINYTDREIPYTRIIEHKHFEFGSQDHTVITYEYPQEFSYDNDPYYPINDQYNQQIFQKYKTLTQKQYKYIFGGRLGEYKYYDMNQVIESALMLVEKELQQTKNIQYDKE